MLSNDTMINDVKIMALGFSYTDEIDENYVESEESDAEDDFESLDDATLNQFDDDIYDDTIDDDDVNVSYDSEYDSDYNDELAEDYSVEE